jgi:hypothetical protein
MNEQPTIRFLDDLRTELRDVARYDAARHVAARPTRLRFLRRRRVVIAMIVVAALAAFALSQDSVRARILELFGLSVPEPFIGTIIERVEVDKTGGVWLAGGPYGVGNVGTVGLARLVGQTWRGLPEVEADTIVALCPVTPDDIWIATETYTGTKWYADQRFMHWDGRYWREIPHPVSPGEQIFDMVALSVDDIWAVGQYPTNFKFPNGMSIDERAHYKPLALHWDGRRWRKVETPEVGTIRPRPKWWAGRLNSVAAGGPDNVWAVGGYGWVVGRRGDVQLTAAEPVVMHWDGEHWSSVRMSNRGNEAMGLSGVVLPDGRRPWVLGLIHPRVAVDEDEYDFVARWDGTAWRDVGGDAVRSYTRGGPGNGRSPVFQVAWDIDGTSPRDVWLAGYAADSNGAGTLHWDGKTWTPVPAPYKWPTNNGEEVGPTEAFSKGVPGIAMISRNDGYLISTTTLFAAGADDPSGQQLLWRWDGSRWTQLHLKAPKTDH